MAQALLLTIAASGAAFFVRRWKADPLALAFLASLIYFAPGPTGVARFSYGEGRGGYPMAFEPLALVVMAIVSLVPSSSLPRCLIGCLPCRCADAEF
jgi:hypothetical protein